MKLKYRAALAASVFAGIYALSAFSSSDARHEVELGVAEARVVRTTILASGEIEFLNSVELRPEITGVVSTVHVALGQSVHRGDVLMTFDQNTLQAELRQQNANVAVAEASVARARAVTARSNRRQERSNSIYAQRLLSRDSFDEISTEADLSALDLKIATQNLEQAIALRARIEEALRKTVIRAPSDGQVIEVAIKEGETAVAGITNFAGSHLLTLADTGKVKAKIYVDEMDVGRVEVGQAVEIDVIAFSDRRLQGRVEGISLAAAPRQNSEGLKYEATVAIDDARDLPVRRGMTARAEIVVTSGQADLTVPLRAVMGDGTVGGERNSYVYAVVDGRARRKWIETGRSDDEYQVVAKGLEAGESLVVGPYQALRDLGDGDFVSSADKAR